MTSEKPKPRHSRRRGSPLPALGFTLISAALLSLAVVNRDTVVAAACRLTGCTPPALAVAGWFVVVIPFCLVWLALIAERLAVKIPLALVAAPAAAVAFSFYPGRGGEFTEVVRGPGAPGFATGAAWALLAVILIVGVGALLGLGGGASFRRGRAVVTQDQVRARVRAAAAGALIAAVALAIALLRAG